MVVRTPRLSLRIPVMVCVTIIIFRVSLWLDLSAPHGGSANEVGRPSVLVSNAFGDINSERPLQQHPAHAAAASGGSRTEIQVPSQGGASKVPNEPQSQSDAATTGATAAAGTADVSTPEALRTRLRDLHLALSGQGGRDLADAATILAASQVQEGKVWYRQKGREVAMSADGLPAAALPRSDYVAEGMVIHDTCALVGNSGTLLGSKLGSEIDAHGAVMRINYPPLKGFESDVGSKTTYDFCNRENARRLLDKGAHFRRSTLLFFEVSSPTNRRTLFGPLMRKRPDLRVQFVHPAFVGRAMELWYDLKAEVERRRLTTYHDKPMSGFLASVFMMQVCRKLDLYGFEAYNKHTASATPYHYFDRVKGVTSVHSFDFAIEAYHLLGEVYRIRVF